MSESRTSKPHKPTTPSRQAPDWEALRNMHKMCLDALRHREQEIVRFLVILGPALGGFIWLAIKRNEDSLVFLIGTYGILFILFVGALYALALGYNYRYLTLQLAKFESPANLKLKKVVLSYWPRQPKDFIAASRIGVIPWCTPPGIIKVFWLAFLVSIAGIAVSGWRLHNGGGDGLLWTGGIAVAIALFWPIQIGRKMLKAARKEDPKDWGQDEDDEQSSTKGENDGGNDGE